MNLIADLTAELGMNESQAKGLAGSVVSLVTQQLKTKVGAEEAEQFAESIPEASQWSEEGSAAPPQADTSPSLLGLAGSLLGGSSDGELDLSGLISMATKFGLDAGSAKALLPILLKFLQSRLPAPLLEKVMGILPMLSGQQTGLGGLGGVLGKLF